MRQLLEITQKDCLSCTKSKSFTLKTFFKNGHIGNRFNNDGNNVQNKRNENYSQGDFNEGGKTKQVWKEMKLTKAPFKHRVRDNAALQTDPIKVWNQ